MTGIVRHPERGRALLLLDCGCWVEVSYEALEHFVDAFGLDPEAVSARIASQHEHVEPPRALRVDLERSLGPDPEIHGIWPRRDRRRLPDPRPRLSVCHGLPVPLAPCQPENRS